MHFHKDRTEEAPVGSFRDLKCQRTKMSHSGSFKLFYFFNENKSEKMDGWKCTDLLILIDETVFES